MSVTTLRAARLERAARRVLEEWESWQEYLIEIKVAQAHNGIFRFVCALEDLKRALDTSHSPSEGKAA